MHPRRAVSGLALLSAAVFVSAGAQPPQGRAAIIKTSGKQLKAHGGELRDIAVSPNGRVLASGGDDKTVRLWSLPSGDALHTLTGHEERVTSLAFTPDSRLLASASEDKSISLWSVADGGRLATLSGHQSWVRTVRPTLDGAVLLSQAENEWRAWSLPDGKAIKVKQFDGNLQEAVMTPDGRTIAVPVRGGVALLSLPELDQKEMLDLGSVRALAISPDGKTLAAAEAAGIRLWSLADHHATGFLQGAKGGALTFTPDGKTLISGDADGAVRIWNPADGRQTFAMTGHAAAVFTLAVTRDGRYVASGSSDSTARLWSIGDGTPVAVFQGHKGVVAHVRMGAEGILVTGQESNFQITGRTGSGLGVRKITADAVVVLWDISPPAFRRYVGR